jgi:hypothetical protein
MGRYHAREDGDSLDAVLVKSERVNGKPRQKVVCYLARVNEGRLNHRALPFEFWEAVGPKLSSLDLSAEEYAKIESQLAAVVRRPSEAEKRKFNEEFEAFMQSVRTAFADVRARPKRARRSAQNRIP